MPRLAQELHRLALLTERRAEALLSGSGCRVNYGEFIILLYIKEEPLAIQRELAHRIGSSEAATSRWVARLTKRGFVDTAIDLPRRHVLVLTPDGELELTRAESVVSGMVDEAAGVAGVDLDDLRDLIRGLTKRVRELPPVIAPHAE